MKDYQRKLFPYAYNILGSTEDAKDIVQDVILKSLSLEQSTIENMDGYLVKSVVNHAINFKKRNSRISTISVWLPAPISTEQADNNIFRKELINYSLLVLLEHLTPTERAVFILKEGFDYSHKEIAELIEISIENSRKLLSRAKNKLASVKEKGHKEQILSTSDFMKNYVSVIENGDVKHLEKLLSNDVSLLADGGTQIKVVRDITEGIQATADLLLYVYQTFQQSQQVKISQINHQPALLFYKKEKLLACQVFEIEDNQVKNIYAVLDPKKLKTLHSIYVY